MRLAFYLDLLERAAWTFAQAFGGTYLASLVIATPALADLASTDRLSIAAAGGVIAVIKVIIASRLPWTADDSGSTLPASVDPPTEPDA